LLPTKNTISLQKERRLLPFLQAFASIEIGSKQAYNLLPKKIV
jgi:hypothetical protein